MKTMTIVQLDTGGFVLKFGEVEEFTFDSAGVSVANEIGRDYYDSSSVLRVVRDFFNPPEPVDGTGG